jgi:hypothetical protein
MPNIRQLPAESGRAASLEALATAVLGVPDRSGVAAKLAIPAARWADLLGALDDEQPGGDGHAPVLEALHRAFYNLGAEDRYLAAMAGVRFPLEAAGVRWTRRLGPADAARDAFDAALGRLRLERQGLELRRWVEIGGQGVDWAIAGLLPTGRAVRVAIVVRADASPVEALLSDLRDDDVAAAGFEILTFRPWQLKWATACALAVAAHLEAGAPHLRFPRRLHDPDEAPPVHKGQAAPVVGTPRPKSPRWGLRQALRAERPGLPPEALLRAYEEAIHALTAASEE